MANFSDILRTAFYQSGRFVFNMMLRIVTFWKPKTYRVTVEGAEFVVRKQTSDWFVVQEVWKLEEYDNQPRGVVVDLGANIGSFAIFASKNAQRVLAFEPEPGSYELLCENIKLNSCTNIEPYNVGIAKKSGWRTLYLQKINVGSSSLYRKTGLSVAVQMIEFADIFSIYGIKRINMLKIDIEGAEHELFSSIDCDCLKKIDKIVMEVHSYTTGQQEIRVILDKLTQAGFTLALSSFLGLPGRWLLLFAGFGLIKASRNEGFHCRTAGNRRTVTSSPLGYRDDIGEVADKARPLL